MKVQLIKNATALSDYVESLEEGLLVIDTETCDLSYGSPLLVISLYDGRGVPCSILAENPFLAGGIPLRVLKQYLDPLFEGRGFIAHNGKFDKVVFHTNGFSSPKIVFDTILAVHVWDSNLIKKLETRVNQDFKANKESFEETIGKKWDKIDWIKDTKSSYDKKTGNENPPLITFDNLGTYAAEDVYWEYKLYEKYSDLLKTDVKLQRQFDEIEMPLVDVLTEMKISGVLIDVPLLQSMDFQLRKEIKRIEKGIFDEAGCIFNLGSPKQKQEVLYKKMKLPVLKDTKTGASTDAAVLEMLSQMGYPIAELMVEWSSLNALQTKYTAAIPDLIDADGRLRGDFNGSGTRTARFSSSNPNLQNQPNNKKFPVRKAFIPKPGYVFVAGDYSQVELRVLASVSEDENMMQAFFDDVDIHQAVADMLGIERDQAKCVHFDTLVYTDRGVKRISSLYPNDTPMEADTFYPIRENVFCHTSYVCADKFYYNGVDDALVITSKRSIIVCSRKHKIQLADGTLKMAQDIGQRDTLLESELPLIESRQQYVHFNPFFKNEKANTKIAIDEDWAYLFGAFTGDGGSLHNLKHTTIAAGVGGKYNKWRKILINHCKKLGLTLSDRKNNNNTMYFGSSYFARFLESAGLVKMGKGKTLRIPETIFNSTKAVRLAFLGGFIDTDGTVAKTGTVSITTKDVILAQDLTILLKGLEYEYGVEACYNRTYNRYYWRIHIYSDSLVALWKEQILKCPWKVSALDKRVTKVFNRQKTNRGRTPFKPNTVNYVGKFGKTPLCDISVVSKNHLYTANTLVTHNTLNFGIIYGMGSQKLALALGVTIAKAKKIIASYPAKYPGYAQWKIEVENSARANGYVRTIFGSVRRLPDVKSTDANMFYGAMRQATNTAIQGAAACIMKLAMVRTRGELMRRKLDAHMLLTVHDELVFEVKREHATEAFHVIKWEMEHAAKLKVPLKVDIKICNRWSDMKDKNYTFEFPEMQDVYINTALVLL